MTQTALTEGNQTENLSVNPFLDINTTGLQPVEITNPSLVNLTEPDISGHQDYITIIGDNHTANFGRLSFSTNPYVIQNSSYVADIGQYLGKSNNQLLQSDTSGDLKVKTTFYSPLIKSIFTSIAW